MEPSGSQPCKVCGCTEVNLNDGFYFCIECGTQNTDMQETLLEMTARDAQNDRFAFVKKTTIKKQKKIEVQMSEEWKIWHAFNFIMANMADELIALGAAPSFKLKLLWVWTKYIKKFHKKEDAVQINRTTNKTFDKNDEEIDSDNDSEKEQPTLTLPDTSAAYKLTQLRCIEKFDLHIVYGLLYIALNLDHSEIQLPDMMRWQREGRLTGKYCSKHVPEDLDIFSIDAWRYFTASSKYSKIRSILRIHKVATALFEVLDVGSPCVPDLSALLNRFCKELGLPKEFRALALSVLDQFVFPANRYFLKGLLPNYDVAVMSCIVIAMKMCFGLDDHYDLKLSFYIDEINDEHNHLHAYRIGVSEPTERKFNIRDWLSFLEYRKQILAKYYYPIAYVYQIGLKEPLGSEGLKDHVTLRNNPYSPWRRRTALDKVQHDIMKTMPLNGTYSVIPKEDFPASLTPLTAYAVFLVERIKDQQERLILTEDFSKYSLKYACEDLCLKSSDADENLITGVSEEYKNVTKKPEILDVPNYKDYPEIYVIDYEYDDWVKDYRDVEKDMEKEMKQTEEEIKNELKNEPIEEEAVEIEKKPDPNMLEEMPENGNIFACFDSPYDVGSLSSSTINNTNSIGEEYGHTFPEEPTQLEAFDPFYFNREEMIKKLVLDACFKYNVPIPREYRETRYVPNRKRTTDEARVRQVHKHPISVTDILNSYKAFVQEEDPLPTPVVQTEEEANSINNEQGMDSIMGNMDTEDNNLNGDVNIRDDNDEINMDNDQENDLENEPMEVETLDDTGVQVTEDVNYIENTNTEMNEEILNQDKNGKKRHKRKAWDFTSGDVKKIKEKKQKSMNDRRYFDPLIKKNIDDFTFKYFIKYLHTKGIQNQSKIEEFLLNSLPNSYRIVLEHCAAIIEHPIYALLEGVQNCETQIFKKYSKRVKRSNNDKRNIDLNSSDATEDSSELSDDSDTEGNNSKSKELKVNTDSDTTVDSNNEEPVYDDTESDNESIDDLDEEKDRPVGETEPVTHSNAVDVRSNLKDNNSKLKGKKTKSNSSRVNIDSDTTVESNDEDPVYDDTESGDESFGDLDEEKDRPVDETEPVDHSNAVDAELKMITDVLDENESSEISIRNESETS